MLRGQPSSSGLPGTATLVRLDNRPDGTVNLVPVSMLVACDPPDRAPHHRQTRTWTPLGPCRTVEPETPGAWAKVTRSHDATEYFIALVRERPALWDADSRDHSKRDFKESMWNDVASLMKKTWPAYGPYTAASMRMLFGNKRRTYRMERKKIRPKSDRDSSGVYFGKWRYFQSMSFLEPMLPKMDLSRAVDEEAMEPETIPLESLGEVLLPDDHSEDNLHFHIIGASSMASGRSSSPEVDQCQPESSSKRPIDLDAATLESFELDMGNQPAPKTARTVAETADCDDAAVYFGKTVTALLRLLSPRKLVRCQAEILGVIERHLVG